MKIAAKALIPAAVIGAFALGSLAPHAQTPAQKVGFVDVAKLLAAHPADKDIKGIQDKADKELGDLDKQVKAIDAKGASATAAEKQNRATLVKTIQAKAAEYDKQLEPKIAAVEKTVDAAVAAAAKANGFGIVMNRDVAAQGLVVYADGSADMTAEAIKAMKP